MPHWPLPEIVCPNSPAFFFLAIHPHIPIVPSLIVVHLFQFSPSCERIDCGKFRIIFTGQLNRMIGRLGALFSPASLLWLWWPPLNWSHPLVNSEFFLPFDETRRVNSSSLFGCEFRVHLSPFFPRVISLTNRIGIDVLLDYLCVD